MDEIKNFFDFTKKFERTYIAAGPVNGRIVVNKDWDQVATKRENLEPDYARKFQSDQEAQMLEVNSWKYTFRVVMQAEFYLISAMPNG